MGFLPVGASAIAAMLFYQHSDTKLMWVAIVAGVVSLWTYGIMHNLAVEAARRRSTYRGGFGDFTPGEVESVPSALSGINMIFTLVSFGVFIMALVRLF